VCVQPERIDWSDRYTSIVRAASSLHCKSAIIDGEAIVQDGNGASDFEALQSALRSRPHSIIVYTFDLLHIDGKDLRLETQRRAKLKTLVADETGTSGHCESVDKACVRG
jgi:bifunctional non-homologous end joining protein LigD